MVELSSPTLQMHGGGRIAESKMAHQTDRFLCIASYEKGQEFMRQCAEMGVKPTLLTVEKLRDAEWPREVLEDHYAQRAWDTLQAAEQSFREQRGLAMGRER